jgi:hypothetical protein
VTSWLVFGALMHELILCCSGLKHVGAVFSQRGCG